MWEHYPRLLPFKMKTDETNSQVLSSPQKWDYLVRTVVDGTGLARSLEKCLNVHGQEGFEAISIIASDQDRLHTVTFKRPCN